MVYISFSEITHVEQLTWYLIDSKAEQMLAIIFPGSSDDKQSVCNAGDLGSIPGLGRSQYSCPENSMDRAWQLQSSP